jgi:hypothetical protein
LQRWNGSLADDNEAPAAISAQENLASKESQAFVPVKPAAMF